MQVMPVLGIILAGTLTASCHQPQQQQQDSPTKVIAPSSATLSLSVTPRAIDKNKVELTIRTNLPLPVTVAASIDLAGQAPTDTYIGYQGDDITLRQPETTVILDTSLADKPLPTGRYQASVAFYPAWGAEGNRDAANAPELHADVPFNLGGSGQTATSAGLRDRRQAWVMESLYSNARWNKRNMEHQLGPSEKGVSDLSPLHDAYYFSGADVTLIVNRVRNEVSIWRLGRATK